MENTIENLTKQKEFLQSACRRAGLEIKQLKDTIAKVTDLLKCLMNKREKNNGLTVLFAITKVK